MCRAYPYYKFFEVITSASYFKKAIILSVRREANPVNCRG